MISDPSGALNFNGKAILHSKGVDFSNGSSFAINMSQLQLEEELGRGNYGTVKRVLHKPTKVYMAMKVSDSSFAFVIPLLIGCRKSAWNSMKRNSTPSSWN
jgi:serine/threonine protein kinase